MSTFTPKRKTESGIEDVTLPTSVIGGLEETLTNIDSKTLAMPRIRVGSVTDVDGTMVISAINPLIFTVEIIDGQLQVGDCVQICTRQLFTYKKGRRRKLRLRRQWHVEITEENVNDRFIYIPIAESSGQSGQRLFRTDSASPYTKTLSPLYIRVFRPIYKDTTVVNGRFSNIVTVWKKYDRTLSKVYIK